MEDEVIDLSDYIGKTVSMVENNKGMVVIHFTDLTYIRAKACLYHHGIEIDDGDNNFLEEEHLRKW